MLQITIGAGLCCKPSKMGGKINSALIDGGASFEYFTARVISGWRRRYGENSYQTSPALPYPKKEGSPLAVSAAGVFFCITRSTSHNRPIPIGQRERILKREKKSAFACEPGRHVFEWCSAHHAIECKLDYSPLLILLEQDDNVSLRASHGGQLLLPAAASA